MSWLRIFCQASTSFLANHYHLPVNHLYNMYRIAVILGVFSTKYHLNTLCRFSFQPFCLIVCSVSLFVWCRLVLKPVLIRISASTEVRSVQYRKGKPKQHTESLTRKVTTLLAHKLEGARLPELVSRKPSHIQGSQMMASDLQLGFRMNEFQSWPTC